jgi:hypothetical protein
MQERVEFRIDEDDAKKHLRPTDGVHLGQDLEGCPTTRKVEVDVMDPLYAKIGELEYQFKTAGKKEGFFLGWQIRRKYTKAELAAAEAFLAIIKHTFEPEGEENGTVYDESSACEYCGAGAVRTTDLILPLSRLPKRGNLALARTIAGEVIASEAFANLFKTHRLQGAEFQPIRRASHIEKAITSWYALAVTAPSATIVPPTRAGQAPFGELDWIHPPPASAAKSNEYRVEDWAGLIAQDARWIEWSQQIYREDRWARRHSEYRCPLGHTIGLNLLSELSVRRADFEGWDLAATAQHVGLRQGVLRPERLLLMSPRLRNLVLEAGLKGITFEVAHLH